MHAKVEQFCLSVSERRIALKKKQIERKGMETTKSKYEEIIKQIE